jgi:hypothetical protein
MKTSTLGTGQLIKIQLKRDAKILYCSSGDLQPMMELLEQPEYWLQSG